LIFGETCLEQIKKVTKSEYEIIERYNPSEFESLSLRHPFDKTKNVKFVFSNDVESDTGTACVHIAPACGEIDYEIGIKNNLEIYSPITDDGKYSKEIIPSEFKNVSIKDAQKIVVDTLKSNGHLWLESKIKHSYPHCWRSRDPLIFRATPQWFFDLSHNDLISKTLQKIEEINFYPSGGKSSLTSTIKNRWEWCLSRQKTCGINIPVLLNRNNPDDYYLDAEFINFIADQIEKNGADYWDKASIKDFVNCGFLKNTKNIDDYIKEDDIFDVWFESGCSHTAVLKAQNIFPASMYLEGIDQHRGWFQSAILSSVAIYNEVPMKNIVTHGFTVDEEGRKMSKSIGNVVDPDTIIQKIGTDGLRLWVASIGNDGDAVVSDKLLNNVSEVYRKIRNTCRFLLKNIVDFNIETDKIDMNEIHPKVKDAEKRLNRFYGDVARLQNREIINLITGRKVLDIGCGYGYLLRQIKQEKTDTEVFGIDIDPEAIRMARSLYDLDVREMSVYKMDFPDGYFDTVILRDTMHHFAKNDDLINALREIRRVCGKELIILDPNPNWIVRFSRKLIGHVDHEVSCGYITDILEDNGFAVKTIMWRDLFAFPLSGGFIGPELIPNIGFLKKTVIFFDKVINSFLSVLHIQKHFCWRYIIYAARRGLFEEGGRHGR